MKIFYTNALKISVLFMSIFIFSCKIDNLCKNEVVEKINSPDNRYTICKFLRDCGATTSKSLHISIKNDNIEIDNDEIGNLLRLKNPAKVIMRWINKKEIEIDAQLYRDDVIFLNKMYKDVRIIYK